MAPPAFGAGPAVAPSRPKGPNAMTTATITAICPECGAEIPFDRRPLNSEIVTCPECGAELEVTSTDPIRLELAPEVEEDWGE